LHLGHFWPNAASIAIFRSSELAAGQSICPELGFHHDHPAAITPNLGPIILYKPADVIRAPLTFQPSHRLTMLHRFFQDYKQLEGKAVEVDEILPAKIAYPIIEDALSRYSRQRRKGFGK
jgi:hypothetical protein